MPKAQFIAVRTFWRSIGRTSHRYKVAVKQRVPVGTSYPNK